MPPVTASIDPRDYPADQYVLGLEQVQELIPHRYEFTQVHRMLAFDEEAETCVAFREGAEDEWWARGHIPGRPMMPGVLMVEALAQVATLHAHARFGFHDTHKWVGFGGVESARFRRIVEPGEDLWLPGKMIRIDTRRGYLKWSGEVVGADGSLVAEAVVIGVSF